MANFRTVIVSASVTAHALAIAALTVMAFWRIDKLHLEDRPVAAPLTFPGTPAPPAGNKTTRIEPKKPDKPERRIVKETVQPKDTPQEPTTEVAETGGESTDEGGMGPGTDIGTETGTDVDATGTCATPPCDGEEPPVVVKKKKIEPVIVAPTIANGLRTAGNAQIRPPESIKVTMLHEGKEELKAAATLCISTTGAIDSVRLTRSTGYAEYDAKLLSEMRAWRYSPYRVGGEAVPFCTAVTFVYKQKK